MIQLNKVGNRRGLSRCTSTHNYVNSDLSRLFQHPFHPRGCAQTQILLPLNEKKIICSVEVGLRECSCCRPTILLPCSCSRKSLNRCCQRETHHFFYPPPHPCGTDTTSTKQFSRAVVIGDNMKLDTNAL